MCVLQFAQVYSVDCLVRGWGVGLLTMLVDVLGAPGGHVCEW